MAKKNAPRANTHVNVDMRGPLNHGKTTLMAEMKKIMAAARGGDAHTVAARNLK